eukprot:3931158-Prorocentrum_lima.AAC.1
MSYSLFAFEELVRDWIDCCAVDRASRGPSLKNRLTGAAALHEQMMSRPLRLEPETSVDYFLTTTLCR